MKHGKLLLERFGLDGQAKALSVNGDWREMGSPIGEEETEEFRAAVARLVRTPQMFNSWRRLGD